MNACREFWFQVPCVPRLIRLTRYILRLLALWDSLRRRPRLVCSLPRFMTWSQRRPLAGFRYPTRLAVQGLVFLAALLSRSREGLVPPTQPPDRTELRSINQG